MNVLQPTGRVFIVFLATSGRLSLFTLTAAFAGMVLALPSYTGFSRFSAEGPIKMAVRA